MSTSTTTSAYTRHWDIASEPDDAGMHEYYYEYDIYRFSDGAICFTARSYVDEPHKAHFLGVLVRGHSRLMVDSDLAQPLFLSALAYLQAQGKKDVCWLSGSGRGNGYESVTPGTSGLCSHRWRSPSFPAQLGLAAPWQLAAAPSPMLGCSADSDDRGTLQPLCGEPSC